MIRVEKLGNGPYFDDAYKVSPEEYKRQLAEADQLKADAFGTANAGDTALEHQDAAVRHTWTNRGWIGENEELNQKAANKIAKNYKDEEIEDNKKGILVEFTKDNILKNKKECCNFIDKQSWARADIFKITNLDKKGNIKISYKIQEVFKKDLKNPNTPRIKENEKIDFLFSLYYNNYVIIKKDNNFDCCIGLYKSSHLNRNCFKINPIENTSNNTGLPKNFEDIGISNLKIFKKFQIDVLGYINEIKNEKRQNINA